MLCPTPLLASLLACLALPQPAKDPAPVPATPPAPTTPVIAPTPVAPALAVTVVSTDAPDLEEWGQKAAKICEAWYPRLVTELTSEAFTPRDSIKIVFRKKMRAPAATAGDTIFVSAPYVRDHADDLGMMVHELAHVVQAYPGQKEDLGWLTEGIADYIRFWVYEPQTRQAPIDRERASYRNSYRTSAAFLGWLSATRDKAIVNKLNARLRAGNADAKIFEELLGASVDDLWAAFIAAGAPCEPPLPEAAPAR